MMVETYGEPVYPTERLVGVGSADQDVLLVRSSADPDVVVAIVL